MAEEILVNGAGEILKLLSSKAIDEIKLVKGVKKEVAKLEAVANKIQQVLEDAEKKQVDDVSVRQWLQELKDVAYWAEDILDEITYESLRQHVETQGLLKNKVRDFFSRFNPLVFRIKMAHKIKDVNLKLGEIEKQKTRFKFDVNPALPLASSSSGANRKTGSLVDDSEVFGRKDDKSKIVEMLLAKRNVEDVLSVIPIVGFGGLGKTTLAQLVYNDSELQGKYDLKMWVYVSDKFDVEKVLTDMIESISKNKFELSNMDLMQTRIRDELKEKTFLLVLDDMWYDSQFRQKWDTLRMCFKSANQGSIVVTTRSEQVASAVHTLYMYDLQLLPSDDCWNLFEKWAFSFGGPEKTRKLEAIGRRIVEKCAGMPLALKVLGGVMHSKHEEKEWLEIEESPMWNIHDADEQIMSVLKLSFDCLAPPLKQCFTYCSILPKSDRVRKAWLVQLWMAEGFLGSSKGTKSMEDIGGEYFKGFCSSSLFQDVEKNEFGEVETCKIHDLVHDLMISLSGTECLILNTKNKIYPDDVSKTRLLAYDFDELRIPRALHPAKKLRSFSTLYAFNKAEDEVFDEALLNFVSLRVLDLGCTGINQLPASIGKLKHLRLLNVCSTRIKELPKSVTCLYNLQTLRLDNCKKLKALPQGIGKLINLRHLEIDLLGKWREMPKGIGKLTSLQTLPVFKVGHNDDDGCSLAELEGLNLLRGEWDIFDLDNVKNVRYAEKANLKAKKGIYSLGLEWDRDEGDEQDGTNCEKFNDDDVLEALQPHSDLKKLMVRGFCGTRFPRWIQSRSTLGGLVEIYFYKCNRCVYLPSCGELPSLKKLGINDVRNVKRIGGAWDEGIDNPKVEFVEEVSRNREMTAIVFPSLEIIYLEKMPNLEEWLEPIGTSFPVLETMDILDCPKLRITPSSFPSLKALEFKPINSGIAVQSLTKNLTSLTHLYVEGCIDLKSLPEELLLNNKLLHKLILMGCPEFEGFLPNKNHTHGGSNKELNLVSSLPSAFIPNEGLAALQFLDIRECPKFHVMPNTLPSLKVLQILNSNKHFMGWVSSKLTSLTNLWIEDIPDMLSLPSELLKNNTLLKELSICDCPQLQQLDEKSGLRSLNRLSNLTVRGCHSLKSLNVQGLDSLIRVEITGCKGLNDFSEGMSLLPSLNILRIGQLWEGEQHEFPFPSTERVHFPSLRQLEICGSPNMKSLSHQLQHLTKLKVLVIDNFDGLIDLPEWLKNLVSLEYLAIWSCENLIHLPPFEAIQCLTSLTYLEIKNCPLLKHRCDKETGGEEWNKISHIPTIKIDDVVIFR
ncbi:hypothetical protein Sjap_008602 [Stephania japonica]|uniref:Uncharacterized protein n=1 Tax=Stephania japonica TaxID=461633 RepID=A0AAP0PB13_9MAGN